MGTTSSESFENSERRFNWLKKTLKEYQEHYFNFFPKNWNLPITISIKFCEITRYLVITETNLKDFWKEIILM